MDLDPEGRRLPIKIDSASNGEYLPRPLQPLEQAANAEAQRFVGEAARKAGLQRRAFLKTCAGSAATLLAFNAVHARAGASGGEFNIPDEAAFDAELAQVALGCPPQKFMQPSLPSHIHGVIYPGQGEPQP